MDLQTWGILLFFFGLPYIIWISAQFKGESPGSALGIVSLVLVANVAVPIAFATFMHRNLSTTMGHSTGLIREQCPVW